MTRYIDERRDVFGVEPVCRVLGVPVSTYYARRSRKPSARERADGELLEEITAARAGYRRVYGARKTWLELRRRGVRAGRDQVARVMRQNGIQGKQRGRRHRTTIPGESAVEKARDLLQRDFAASGPNEKWVCDITYLRTWNGFRYLAFVLDCFSRRIVGWQLATHMRTELVLEALEMANGLRRPASDLIAHSDRGSQYTSVRYTERLEEIGAAPSVGSRGGAYDNAIVVQAKTSLDGGTLCRLQLGGNVNDLPSAVAVDEVEFFGDQPQRASAVLLLTGEITQADQADLYCFTSFGGATGKDATIVATKVGTLNGS